MSTGLHTVHVRINDAATGQPTPVRIRFSAPAGEYFAPFGRLTDFATARYQEVGGNVLLNDRQYAHIDGTCEVYLPASPIVVTTEVTTSMVGRIARSFNAQVVDNLLVGFKYIAEVIWQLESTGGYEDVTGTPADFVLGCEESHGLQTTADLRDKDAAVGERRVAVD